MTSPAAISLACLLLGVLSLVAIVVRRVDGGARRDREWRKRNERGLQVVQPNRRRA